MHRHGHERGPEGLSSRRRGRGGFWPMAAMLIAGRGGFGPEGSFGRNGPFGPDGPFGQDGPYGRGGGGRGAGGRGRRRMFGSGELRLVLLKLIADAPRHGYNLIRAIEEQTGGDYAPSPGVVYPTLSLLDDEGLIEQLDEPGVRRAYAATDAGRAELTDKADEVEALFERLAEASPEREGKRHPPIGRAIGNLMTALRQRVSHDGFDDALMHEITEILDDAARRIERLKQASA